MRRIERWLAKRERKKKIQTDPALGEKNFILRWLVVGHGFGVIEVCFVFAVVGYLLVRVSRLFHFCLGHQGNDRSSEFRGSKHP